MESIRKMIESVHLNLGRCKRSSNPTKTTEISHIRIWGCFLSVLLLYLLLLFIMNLKIIPIESFFANNDASFLLAKNILIYEMNYVFTNQTVIFRWTVCLCTHTHTNPIWSFDLLFERCRFHMRNFIIWNCLVVEDNKNKFSLGTKTNIERWETFSNPLQNCRVPVRLDWGTICRNH